MNNSVDIIYILPLLGMVGVCSWAIVKYVNGKNDRAEDHRRQEYSVIHARINSLEKDLAYEQGRREERERQEGLK